MKVNSRFGEGGGRGEEGAVQGVERCQLTRVDLAAGGDDVKLCGRKVAICYYRFQSQYEGSMSSLEFDTRPEEAQLSQSRGEEN